MTENDRVNEPSVRDYLASALRDGGPPVSWVALCAYAADRLDPADRRRVERWIATYRPWSDAFWELVADLDAEATTDQPVPASQVAANPWVHQTAEAAFVRWLSDHRDPDWPTLCRDHPEWSVDAQSTFASLVTEADLRRIAPPPAAPDVRPPPLASEPSPWEAATTESDRTEPTVERRRTLSGAGSRWWLGLGLLGLGVLVVAGLLIWAVFAWRTSDHPTTPSTASSPKATAPPKTSTTRPTDPKSQPLTEQLRSRLDAGDWDGVQRQLPVDLRPTRSEDRPLIHLRAESRLLQAQAQRRNRELDSAIQLLSGAVNDCQSTDAPPGLRTRIHAERAAVLRQRNAAGDAAAAAADEQDAERYRRLAEPNR